MPTILTSPDILNSSHMPRKKSEPKDKTQDQDVSVEATDEVATRMSTEKSLTPDSTSQNATGSINTVSSTSTNGRAFSKLDSLDFYRTQLKLEGLESDVAKTDKEAGEINRQILEIAKQEMNLEVGESDPHENEQSREEQLEKAREHIQDLYKRLENTRVEKDALNHEIAQLRDDLTRSYHETKTTRYNPNQNFGTVVRISEDTFSSSQFRDGRYEVRLARDGSYIRFKPDVEGRAICKDNAIRLPRLPSYIPYKGPREFGIIPVNENTIMIRL